MPRRLHAVEATRVHQTRPGVVSFSISGEFGPSRDTRRLSYGHVDGVEASQRRHRRDHVMLKLIFHAESAHRTEEAAPLLDVQKKSFHPDFIVDGLVSMMIS